MALQKQTLSLNFEKGLNQKASDRVLNVPHMADIQNGRMEKSGEIRRRAGLEPLQNDNLPNNGKYDEDLASLSEKIPKVANLEKYKDGLLWMDGKHAYQNLTDDSYVRSGVCDSIVMHNEVIRDDRGLTQSRPELARIDNATYGNFILAVWYEIDCSFHNKTGGSASTVYNIYAQLYDADTDVQVGSRQLVDTVTFATLNANFEDERAYLAPKPRVLAVGTSHFVILYNKVYGTANHLRYRIIKPSNALTLGAVKPSSTSSLIDVGKFSCWDACAFNYNGVTGITIFAQLDSGTNSFSLQEYKINSEVLSTSGMRSAYTIAHSAEARLVLDYSLANPNAYGLFVRHFQPNGSSSDVAGCYAIGFNALSGGVAKARCVVLDASSGTIAIAGGGSSFAVDPDSEGMLNGSAVLDPSPQIIDAAAVSTHVRVYYVTDSRDSDVKPNFTTMRSIKIQISNNTSAHTEIARNTGLLSDPWVYDNRIYFMGSECIAQKAGTNWDASHQDFSAGCTYIFRDSLSDTPGIKNLKRDRCIPVAKTGEADIACNPFTNWFLLQRDFANLAAGELASNMYYGVSAVIPGKTPDQRLIGNSRWAPLLVGEECTFAGCMVTVQHKPRRELPTAELNNALLIGGGYLKVYDGQTIHENGFFRAPQIYATISSGNVTSDGTINSMTGRIETGTYNYTAIYEWVDGAGNIHRSRPSNPLKITNSFTNSDGYNQVKVYTYNHSLKYYEDVRVVLYRTPKDQSTYFRIGDVANDWDSDFVTFTDIYRDDDIFPDENPAAAHEALYSDLEKANGSLGSVTDLVIHKNRIMFVTSDNRVHASKPTVQTVAAEVYSDTEFQFGEIEGGKEAVYGIETTGDHLLVFTSDNVYAITGEGPDSNGGTARFSEPRLLVKGQGSLEGTIHINCARGVLYQAERGFYLIDRQLQSLYIGAPIEDLGIYRGLTSELDDSKHEVYIPLGDRIDGSVDAVGYSTVAVYNYFFDAWTRYTFDKTYVGYNSKGLVLSNNKLYYGRMQFASYSGRTDTYELNSSVFSGVWKVDETKFWDTKYGPTSGDIYSKYTTVIETPHIYTNNLQGAQRIYKVQFLGDHKGDHDVTVEMTVDYNDSTAHSQTKTASTFIDKHCYQIPVKRQKSRALKVKHTITPNAASTITNEMFRMDGMALEVGFRPTTFALPKGDQI